MKSATIPRENGKNSFLSIWKWTHSSQWPAKRGPKSRFWNTQPLIGLIECLFIFEAFVRQLYENKGINNRFPQTIPDLGAINSGKNENEFESNSDQQSLMRDKECVICMDHQRGNDLILQILMNLHQSWCSSLIFKANFK